jgi:hypothetical protein
VVTLQGSQCAHFVSVSCLPAFPFLSSQGVSNFRDIQYNESVTYGELFLQNEYEMSVSQSGGASPCVQALACLSARVPGIKTMQVQCDGRVCAGVQP